MRQPISALKDQKRAPNRKKVAKMAGFLFSDEAIASIGQIQQRANHPYSADPAKNAQGASGYNGPKSANEGYGKEGV